jgi:hypothetical protein
MHLGWSVSGVNNGNELQMLLMMRLLMASWLMNRTLLKRGNLAGLRQFEQCGVAVVGVEAGLGVGLLSMILVNIGSTGIQ